MLKSVDPLQASLDHALQLCGVEDRRVVAAKAMLQISSIHLAALFADGFKIGAHFFERVGHEDARIEAAHRLLDAPIGITGQIRQCVNHHACQAG